MQTFLAYPDFVKSAKVLDRRRLGCQRKEARQILYTITNNKKAWSNHPAVKMWRGYETALSYYGDCIIQEWVRRGYQNNMKIFGVKPKEEEYPEWFGTFQFHRSHRSNLIRKFPEHYRQFWPYEKDDLPYVWPVK